MMLWCGPPHPDRVEEEIQRRLMSMLQGSGLCPMCGRVIPWGIDLARNHECPPPTGELVGILNDVRHVSYLTPITEQVEADILTREKLEAARTRAMRHDSPDFAWGVCNRCYRRPCTCLTPLEAEALKRAVWVGPEPGALGIVVPSEVLDDARALGLTIRDDQGGFFVRNQIAVAVDVRYS